MRLALPAETTPPTTPPTTLPTIMPMASVTRAHTGSLIRALTRLFTLAVLSIGFGARAGAQPRATVADSTALFRTIAMHDSVLFEAYNRCDLATFGRYLAPDLEFYHDQSGLMRGRKATVDAVRRNICGKVHRDLVPGTLEVHRLKTYGAVQIGVHRFCDPRVVQHCDASSGEGRFVMIWQLAKGQWRLTRIISFDHVSR